MAEARYAGRYRGYDVYYDSVREVYEIAGVGPVEGQWNDVTRYIDGYIEELERRMRVEAEPPIVEVPREPEIRVPPPVAPPEEVEEEEVEIPVVEVPPEEEEVEIVPVVPEIPEVPELTLPELPWYAAWLKPIIDYIGTLTEAVVNFFAPIFAPIGEVAAGVVGLPAAVIERLKEAAGDIVQRQRDRGTSIAVDTLKDALEGSPQWMVDLKDGLGVMETTILGEYNKAVDPATYEKSPLSGEEAVEALVEMKQTLVTAAIANFGLHALVEAGSLGQMEFMKDLDSLVISKYGLDAVVSRTTMIPLEAALFTPASQYWLSLHPNEIPTYTDLINMVVKEVIELDRFKEEMLKLGFREEWSQFIWDAHFRPPSWEQLLNAYYRGAISREELDAFKVLVDLDPRYDVVWNSLIEVIPPYSDLARMRTKEIITPEDYAANLKKWGYDPAWAERIYQSTLIPPSLGDLLVAWRRGIIGEERLDELMILVDLDPRFKDIFDTRKYIDPSLTLTRYLFEVGAVDEARVTELVARQGFRPEDIEPVTTWVIRFQERRFRTMFLRAMATAAVYGAYTEGEVLDEVTKAGYTPAVAEWMIRTAQVQARTREARRKAPAPKLLGLGDLKKSYARDLIDEDVFRRELMTRNYEIGDVDLLITLMDSDKVTTEAGGRKIALSQSELLNAWRWNEVGEDYVRTELQLRGLALDEANILINTKRKQWSGG